MRPKITATQVASGLLGAVTLGLVLVGVGRAAIPPVGIWLMDEGRQARLQLQRPD